METYLSEKSGSKVKLVIENDCDAENPREWENNISTLICFNSRSGYGDNHSYTNKSYGSVQEVIKAIKKDLNPVLCYNLYIYKHGSVSLSLIPFNDSFDSWMVGCVIVEKEKLESYFPQYKKLTKRRIEQIKSIIEMEIDIYTKYLNGDVYKYVIYDGEECIETSGNYYDVDECRDYGLMVIKELNL